MEVVCRVPSGLSPNDIQNLGAKSINQCKEWIGKDDARIRVLWWQDVRGDKKSFVSKGMLLASTTGRMMKKEQPHNKIEIDGIFDQSLHALVAGIDYARELTSLPPNILNPETFVTMVSNYFSSSKNITIRVLDQQALEKEGMNLVIAVGKWSTIPPRLMVIEYNYSPSQTKKPICLVGKWVTYDSGGYYPKSYPSMNEMYADMGGAATVIWIIETARRLDSSVSLVWVIPLVENMISWGAMKNGDVYTAKNWLTVMVSHSDAEGRLIVADALTYADEKYTPKMMIDFATLTWACRRALGELYSGIFGFDDNALIPKLLDSCKRTNDLWRQLPLDADCVKAVKGVYTDVDNVGKRETMGASTAAAFLSHFVTNKHTWIHCDIAGTALRTKQKQDYDDRNVSWTWPLVHAVCDFLGIV